MVLCFAAPLEHLTMCKKEKEQTTTPISLGVWLVVEFTQAQFETFFAKLNVPSELKFTVRFHLQIKQE